MLADLATTARRKGILNLKTILSTESGRELPRGASLYFMANVFHELDDKKAYLKRLYRCLGPESRLAIVDYHKRKTKHGPAVAHRVSGRQAGALLASAGFGLVEAFEVNSEEYGLVAGKNAPQEAA
jgi:hypothetical protein